MKSVLITGGAGFIGSKLAKFLLDDGYKVTIVDDFSYGKMSNLPVGNTELSIHKHSILNQEKLESIFSQVRPSVVFHLAAIHHIPTCELNPPAALMVNVEGSSIVFEVCKKYSVEKVLFASSGAVYDTLDTELKEDATPIVPRDIYSISKVCGEDMLRLYSERNNFQGVSCRLFNAIGPGETNAHLIPEILQQLQAGKDTVILGNLNTYRSYIHVSDVAEAIFRLSKRHQVNSYEIFNIGNEKEYCAEDLLKMIEIISGKKINVQQSQQKKRPNDRLTQRASMKKLQSELGWLPTRSIESALSDAFFE